MSSYDLSSVYGGGGNASYASSQSFSESSSSAPRGNQLINYPAPSYEVSDQYSSALSCADGSCSSATTYSDTATNTAGNLSNGGSFNAPTTPVLSRILIVFLMSVFVLSLTLLVLASCK